MQVQEIEWLTKGYLLKAYGVESEQGWRESDGPVVSLHSGEGLSERRD